MPKACVPHVFSALYIYVYIGFLVFVNLPHFQRGFAENVDCNSWVDACLFLPLPPLWSAVLGVGYDLFGSYALRSETFARLSKPACGPLTSGRNNILHSEILA